ncbi:amino acid permease [Planosporangium thailandense]|uniref:Amino acid permease n=2 Tax=Planosporangium thailandense TaxID=765197 RepID=A0ABX0Y049_9ACTN|nr:amino acid permease [Planosporangium thailandense]
MWAGVARHRRIHRLGLGQGTALFVGAVLGPGVLALPRLAAAAAGPASLVAWGTLLALSVPVSLTFAALGARFPGNGGVATFAASAFGRHAAAVVGWWFFLAVPIGVPAGALIGGEYVGAALGLDGTATARVACALVLAVFVANYIGLRLSGAVQLLFVVVLIGLLVAAVAAAAPDVEVRHFVPFAPHGWTGVASAAGVLFFAFAGWEAASTLSAEFRNPRKHLPWATVMTLIVVGVLYLGLAVTTVGVLGDRAATSPVPLASLLERGIGGAADAITAGAAVFLTFGALNTYLAGGARLGAALASHGALPRLLAKGGAAGEVPRRSLTLLALLAGLVTAVTLVFHVDLDALMRATAACLAAVTIVGTAAAVRILPPRTAGRRVAMAATAFAVVVLASCGVFLVFPVAVALVVVAVTGGGARRAATVPAAAPQESPA